MLLERILNQILTTKNYELLGKIDREYLTEFPDFEPYFELINEHIRKYNVMPSVECVEDKFVDWSYTPNSESADSLLHDLREEYTYKKFAPILQQAVVISAGSSNANVFEAIDYLTTELQHLDSYSETRGRSIIKNARERYIEYTTKKASGEVFIPSGFKELDLIIGGLAYAEELILVYGRTGMGKSFVSEKMAISAWEAGKNVMYFSPEMSANKVGFRFDTLHAHFSSKDLYFANPIDGYGEYIDYLEKRDESDFIVTTPNDFAGKVTVSKLKRFVANNNIDALFIDGIYITDERSDRTDNLTIKLTHISEDLMTMSTEMKLPIIVVAQANREGITDGMTPRGHTVRGSDGILQNASKAIAIQSDAAGLKLTVEKNRNEASGNTVTYFWDVEKGIFTYIPKDDDGVPEQARQEAMTAYGDMFKQNDIFSDSEDDDIEYVS